MVELIIAEKPDAAMRIANSLSDETPKKKTNQSVAYYEIIRKGKKIIVASAVGHLFTISEKKKSYSYPVFDVEWKPSYLVSRNSKFTKKYFDTIKRLAKEANEFTVATDYDLEGSVIGANCIRFICSKKDAKRMKFSTLTKSELQESYENSTNHLDFPQVEAGETRHMLDYFWGISTSRALTLAIKNSTNHFKIMSSGRVQGPALKLIVDKEKEIQRFKPTPFWQIELLGEHERKLIVSIHRENKFLEKGKAEEIFKKIQGSKAFIKNVSRNQFTQQPPHPFDLTALQIEAYRALRVSPKETLTISQELYTKGLISYPRTSSNQLPPNLNYKKIIESLIKQENYRSLVEILLEKNKLIPNNGKKIDKAHPAIYPTGEIPEKINEKSRRIYDLIVRRTLASFSDVAVRETIEIEIEIKNEIFITKGTRTIEKGWHIFYGPYTPFKEEELPDLKKGQELMVKKISLLEKETQPPKRYTPASVIKELEKKELGTKATRSVIIDTLYQRNYISEESIQATNLGIKTIETLEKYCSEIVDEELTRHFEGEINQIQDEKRTKEETIAEAKKILIKIFKRFKDNEENIGKALAEANLRTREEQNIVGNCEKCGKALRITYSKKNKHFFVACSGYPECTNTFSVPSNSLIKPSRRICKECNFPTVFVIRKGKRPFEYCINRNCKLKEEWLKNKSNK